MHHRHHRHEYAAVRWRYRQRHVHPGATETCNGVDDNCNGTVDEGLPTQVYYADSDGDNFGNVASPSPASCAMPAAAPSCPSPSPSAQWVTNSGDCDDTNASVNPGAPEVCNGVDDNCNGVIDESLPVVAYYADCDADNFGIGAAIVRCSAPTIAPTRGSPSPSAHWATTAGDCNDNTASVNPGAPEVCNGVDDNCNGLTDDGLSTSSYFADCDSDSYGAPGTPTVRCSLPATGPASCPAGGWSTNGLDCIDTNATLNPGTGSFVCGASCGSNTNASACGASCSVCSAPSNATATCTGGTCGYGCNSGYHACGSTFPTADMTVATLARLGMR